MPDLRFWLAFVEAFTIVVGVLMILAAVSAWWDWKKEQMTAEDRMTGALRNILICAAILILVFVLGIAKALSQHVGHPPEHMELHSKFYKTWMMPDNRAVSCCHDEDCFPAQAKNVNGTWFARKNEGDEWIKIPASKVEFDRDTPDGRSHLCGRHYGFNDGNFSVFCFIAGIGG